MDILDYTNSQSVGWIARDLAKDVYGLRAISFVPGDIVIDLGANTGMFCTLLAKQHPGLRILALEARQDNYEHLLKTLHKNNVTTVEPHFLAIAGNARDVVICGGTENSGGGAIYPGWYGRYPANTETWNTCHTMTLDQLFLSEQITTCKLLKCDIEGAEYEVFAKTKMLPRIDYLSMECHDEPEYLPRVNVEAFVQHVMAQMCHPTHFTRAYP